MSGVVMGFVVVVGAGVDVVVGAGVDVVVGGVKGVVEVMGVSVVKGSGVICSAVHPESCWYVQCLFLSSNHKSSGQMCSESTPCRQ